MDAIENLRAFLSVTKWPHETIAEQAKRVRTALQTHSPHLQQPNFVQLATLDLAHLFDAYNDVFFAGRLRGVLEVHRAPLSFRLANRMTRIGGKTSRWRGPQPPDRFEIAISTTLLFQSFRDNERDKIGREIIVNGYVCRDRLDALQRVFEHEIVHLAELLAWDDTNCKADQFADIAKRIFGHTGTTHELVLQQERAWKVAGITVGDRVTFVVDGVSHTGIVNRITKRASVLVENPAGRRYTNGKHYLTYYVPLSALTKVENENGNENKNAGGASVADEGHQQQPHRRPQ